MTTFFKLTFLFWAFALPASMSSQYQFPVDSAASNPLSHPREISANREIALIYGDYTGGEEQNIQHKFFDVNQLDINDLNTDIALETTFPVYTGAPASHGNHRIGSCAGDFNGDHVDDYITCTQGPLSEIYLRAYDATLSGTELSVQPMGSGTDIGYFSDYTGALGFSKLASGNFDSSDDDEAVLLYRNDNGTSFLRLVLYDLDAGLNLIPVGNIEDEQLDVVSSFESFDLQVIDLDYDGTDEIVIAGSQVVSGNRQPYVKVYDVTMSGGVATIIPREKTYVPTTISSGERMTIALTTGDFNNDFIQEIALAYGYQVTDGAGDPDTWLRIFRVGDDSLNTPGVPDWLEKTVLLPQYYESTESNDQLTNLDLDAGDVDGDGSDDIVMGTSNEIQLFSISDDFSITSTSPLNASYSNAEGKFYDQFITVADMNNDGRAEVLNMRNWLDQSDEGDEKQYISVNINLYNPGTLSWQSLAINNTLLPDEYTGSSSIRQYSVVIGDFDGDNVYFGDFEHYVLTDIVQPIIILNAPPTHSDDIGTGNWRDVNGIWEDGDCSGFTSHYSETTTESFTIETSISDAWSISASVGAEFDGLVASASASLEASYGENYTNTNANTETTTEVTVTTSCFDDAIYASIITYDVYEYPLYVGDSVISYVVSIHPRRNDIQYQWISSKSLQGQNFISKHEPGNILSYRPFSSPQFVLSAQDEFNGGTNFNISSSISNAWEVTTEQVAESGADTERTIGMEASASFGVFGVSATVTGSYDWTGISTHKSSIGDAIAVGIDLGTVPIASNDAVYSLKPYIFWGEGNEVVLDYEVSPNSEFYANNYSVQDPAWNMPWRLDEERGYTLSAQTKTRQSKSIWFDKKFPQPGDTITVHARIFNYSLVATEAPVEVKFFFGNPYNGGVAVTDIDGATTVTTDTPIASQQYKEVEFTIALPADFDHDGRLYARIDPDSVMTEVHEENNLCWRALGPYFPMSAEDYEGVGVTEISSADWQNFQCYPNPVNDILSVTALLNDPGNVQLSMWNMQGVLVKDFGQSFSGKSYNRNINIGELSAGIYMMKMSSNGKTSTARVVVQ